MKKATVACLLAILSLTLFTACSSQTDRQTSNYADSIEDFYEKIIGVQMGTVSDGVTQNQLRGTPAYYSETSAGLEDVRKNRIDGYMADLSVLRVLIATPGNEDLSCFAVPEEMFSGPMGGYSLDQDIIDRFNVFLADLEDDGTLVEMQGRWLENVPDLDSPMPDIPLNGGNGTLRIATTGTALPFAYVGANGELKGYSIELAMRFAAHEGMRIEFFEMDFSAMIPYIVAGRADLGLANVSITEERKKSVIFTEPIFYDQLGIVALSGEGAGTQSSGFLEWLQNGFENNLLVENRWQMVLSGLGVTMVIAVLSQLLGTAFGAVVAFILTRRNRFIRWLGNLYCGLIHGTPVVVLLMITYYIIFGDTDLSGILIAVAAFSLITGANVALNLKGAIETVDPVEIEAARSIGFPALAAFRTVTLPQAIRRALPGYTNGFVELVKATAIVGYIAIQDLTRAGDIIRSRTYDAFFPLLFVAVIYLIVTTLCVQLFKLIVGRINGDAK